MFTYVDECCCNDDSRTEIFCYKECPFRNLCTFIPTSKDRESGTCFEEISTERFGQQRRHIPNREPTKITKMADTRTPMRPS